jgi:hypothetical protein
MSERAPHNKGYVHRHRRRRGFRLVYRLGDRWHWHANVQHRPLPHRPPYHPDVWHNRSGRTRFRTVGWVKAWAAWAWMRVRVERHA